MPDPKEEYINRASNLERKLRALKRHVVGICKLGEEEIPVGGKEAATFKAQFASASQYWEEFKTVWSEREKLHSLLKEDTFPDDQWNSLYDRLRDEMIEAKATLIELNDRESLDKTVSSPPLNVTTGAPYKPQLPKIQIPIFSGDLLKWTHFRDTFLSIVHNEPSLSNVEKFHYLIGALKGEAATLLSRFPVEEKSYLQAWEKVVQTFDNPRILASLLINRMINCDVKGIKNELQRYESFLTGVADSIDTFRVLKLQNPCEFLLATLALRALDPETRRHFELSLKSDQDFPSADDVISFVRQRKTALKMSQGVESASSSENSFARSSPTSGFRSYPNRGSNKYKASVSAVTLHSTDSSTPKDLKKAYRCFHCQDNHRLAQCKGFLEHPVKQRMDLLKSWKLCFNCLYKGHSPRDCRSRFRCKKCNEKHHTLIHQEPVAEKREDGAKPEETGQSFACFGSSTSVPTSANSTVLLGTVRLLASGDNGVLFPVRAVLDSGSHHSFVTSALTGKLGVTIQPFHGSIRSLAETDVPQSHLKGIISCTLRPYEGGQNYAVRPIVVDRITSALPTQSIPSSVAEKLNHYKLSDHQFGESRPVDLLIGGDLFPYILTGSPIASGVNDLLLLPTTFGLVVSGSLRNFPSHSTATYFLDSQSNITAQLKKFWEIEEPSPVDRSHPYDVFCEEHFVRTQARDLNGRYIVRLPFQSDFTLLGNNREMVIKRFHSLENKLRRDPELREQYNKFMKEYLDLGHMSPAVTPSAYLIPHHGVWQERPSGTKLRVVFDASCTSDSISLNEALLSGPKLQEDICNILIRFRLYVVPLCCDLVKMYRQILIHPEDRKYQHIVWRENCSDALMEYELNTVTYGVKSSAYQALRVIKQLIVDEGPNHPLAASRVVTDMYVDDLVTGADSVEEATCLQRDLINLFQKGGFTLDKWASSVSELIPSKHKSESVSIRPPGDDWVKILGLTWNPCNDQFSYSALTPPSFRVTKRVMLSSVAKIFDPLGLIAPVIFTAKSLIQEVWKAGLGWDDELPDAIMLAWKELTSDWSTLSSLSIPRYASLNQAAHRIIGFCDASAKGYAAVLYLRAEAPDASTKISLIKAKSKVAPVKFCTIPRLELCGALLLSRLISSLPKALAREVICFTDSEVVLAWLKTPVHDLRVFEANRVSQILSVVPSEYWQHVRSEENPADVASRGCLPSQLKNHDIWWQGPGWLESPIPHWFETRDTTVVMASFEEPRMESNKEDWISRFSSFPTLIRTTARILSFIRRRSTSSPSQSGIITAEEFSDAEMKCAWYSQRRYFSKEIFPPASNFPRNLAQLAPFLDERGILRVGGRLQDAPLTYSGKHPILIPYLSPLSRLIIQDVHVRHFHAGPTLTLALIRNKYWIPRARKLIRNCINRCVRCRTLKAKPAAPFMASLPKERFAQFRAFIEVGVDYAGPFLIKESTRRNAPVSKAYLSIFICFASKAVHLELVSSLTTTAFLDALERFISRRGVPKCMWSDHGTNFVGASRFLKDVYRFQNDAQPSVVKHLSPRGIEWKFIPPRAPHFGGLWEAGVKSVKSLLAASLGKTACTFQELTTAFAKIEALLNSRPLCGLTEDPFNYDFLTPGHFLIGAPLHALPEPSETENTTLSHHDRWRIIQAQIAHVWNRWRKEYLHTLQQRSKWTRQVPGIKVGDLVILLEKKPFLAQWPVARVVETFPGRDGVTRTVSVRTPSGSLFTRAVTSLVPLFYPEQEHNLGK